MTITFELWHLIPASLVVGALVFFWIGSRESGMLGGLFPGLLGVGLLCAALMFMLGRWLS